MLGIQLTNLDYHVGAYPLFQNLNATFPLGEVIGIIGANGSGKSTLLHIISGLCQPRNGSVLFCQQDIYENHEIRSSVGFVPTAPMLYPHLTVKENLQWLATLKDIPRAQFKQALPQLLHHGSLQGYEQVLFGKLSDGLKKRAGIVAQLLHHPKLLVLDEPCAELDPMQRQQLWDVLQKWRSPERVILFSSHHPLEITLFCDAIYLLRNGQLHRLPKQSEFTAKLWQRAGQVYEEFVE